MSPTPPAHTAVIGLRPANRALTTAPALLMSALLSGLLSVMIIAGTARTASAQPLQNATLLSTATPATPTKLSRAIEPLGGYVPDNSCAQVAQPGTLRLARLLTSTYSGTGYLTTRPCGSDGLASTEHYDGRAVDWMNSLRNPKQKAQATAVLNWLFATDRWGNRYANARRLGVMYIIWNNRIWGAYSAAQGWRPYSSCAAHPEISWDTTCHRNHMHISLTWEGSQARTSFWTGTVAARDYGPCRAADLNWARPYRSTRLTPCPSYRAVQAPARSSALMKQLVKYSGMKVSKGATGPAVSVVQQAVKAPVTGRYGSATVAAMKAWKRAHGVPATSAVTTLTTWRALLKANAPRG